MVHMALYKLASFQPLHVPFMAVATLASSMRLYHVDLFSASQLLRLFYLQLFIPYIFT